MDDFINTGLYQLNTEGIMVFDQDDWKASNKYKIEGGETRGYITEIGKKIRHSLNKRC